MKRDLGSWRGEVMERVGEEAKAGPGEDIVVGLSHGMERGDEYFTRRMSMEGTVWGDGARTR